jgi:hypothetical protein
MTRLNAKLLLRDGDAVFVDGRFSVTVDVLERRLERFGLRVVDVHRPLLEPETLDVRIEAPHVEMDPDSRAEIDRRYRPAPYEVELQEGRYRLAGIVAWGDQTTNGNSPARRFAELVPLVADRDGRIAPDDLDTFRRVTDTCEVVRIPHADAHQLVRALRNLTRSSR